MSVIALFLLATIGPHGPNVDEPPIAGRPVYFDGAIGVFTSVSASAEPTDLQVEDALRFTMQIRSTGIPQHPPARPNLRGRQEFSRLFLIEDLPDPIARPDSTAWEFRYRLRPLNQDATEVPAVRFDYYRPGMIPPEKGYQTRYSEPIPLNVRPRRPVPPAEVLGGTAPAVPDSVFEIAEGPDVLRRERPRNLIDSPFVPIAVIGMLLPCAAWYLAWRLNPDIRRPSRQRLGTAARQAIRNLKSNATTPDAAADVMAKYLRLRWGFPMGEVTPDETIERLQRNGVTPDVTESAGDFFKSCDVNRFDPSAAASDNLVAAGLHLISRLETPS